LIFGPLEGCDGVSGDLGTTFFFVFLLLSFGMWQSSPTPRRQTHFPSFHTLKAPQSGCFPVGVRPQVPSWYDRALQHMPLIVKFGGLQVVVVGVGQSLPVQVGSTG
jgi:hypothetical protein